MADRLFFSPWICGLDPQEILDSPQEIFLIYSTLLLQIQENGDIPRLFDNFRNIEKSNNLKYSMPSECCKYMPAIVMISENEVIYMPDNILIDRKLV